MNKQQIIEQFKRANLPVVVTTDLKESGFRSRDDRIFQMTIRQNKKQGEWFVLYMGKDNDIKILDTNEDLRQLIIELNEPEREFEVLNWNPKKRKNEPEIRKTNPNTRRLLMGMDEIHLFMSELPNKNIQTVYDAHELLKPNRVRKIKRAKIIRQGEWFFVPANKSEKGIIRRGVVLNKTAIANGVETYGRKDHFRYGGKPHKASNLIIIVDKGEIKYQFAKGDVTHVDHATITLKGWHRVYRNTEIQQRSRVTGQIITRWVD